jgi:hypothetical protein
VTAAAVTALAQMGAGVRRGAVPALTPEAWAAVLDLAERHRVAPLVAQALADAPGAEVPPSVRAAFDAQRLQSSATRMLCESVLASLLATLEAAGLEVIVLKGPSVAHAVYPSPELRVYHDLDLLCRAADYGRLRSALLEAGYAAAPFEPTGPSDGSHEALAPTPSPSQSHSVRAFLDPSGDVKIEVHFDLLQFGLVDRRHEAFWRGAQALDAGGLRIPVLAPEHQLLHLAAHAQRHCFSRLQWLVDLDLFLRRYADRLDWPAVVQIAREEGMGAVLRRVLEMAHGVLGAPMPALPPPTLEERALGICYRALWPLGRVRRLEQHEHKRLLKFLPDTAYRRDVAYSFVLLGRRREKLEILRRQHGRRRSSGAAVRS